MSVETLVQLNQNTQNPRIKKITDSYIKAKSPFAEVPMKTDRSDRQVGRRYTTNNISTGWRKYNVAQSSQVVTASSFEETIALMTNTIAVDRAMVNLSNEITDVWDTNIQHTLEAQVFGGAWCFFNNDPNLPAQTALNPSAPDDPTDSFTGLKARLTYPKYLQNIAQCVINSNQDISTGAGTGNAALNILAQMRRMFANMGSPGGDNITVWNAEPFSRAMPTNLARGVSGATLLKTITDAYNRTITEYDGSRWIDSGRQQPKASNVQTLYNISCTENADGTDTGVGTKTSLYFTRNGEDQFMGWHYGSPDITDPYPLPGGVQKEVAISYECGLWPQSTICIGRMFNIDVAGF